MKRPPALVALHYALLVLLALFCLAPIAVIFATSLRQQVQVFAEPLNFIFMPTLENYRAVIQEDKLDRYLANSLIVGLVEALGAGYLGGKSRDVVPYVVVLAILVVRPYGIFGTRTIERL